MLKKDKLWLALRAYHFDHLVPEHLWDKVKENFGGENASLLAFADKIARKLNWKTAFALRAIEEYKKFVYMGIIGDFIVTPSKIIDAVWHEHLLFSKGYRDFCTEIIKRDFDHNPELVPVSEQTSIFNRQYQDTLELYKKEFGVDPPSDIWSITKFNAEKVQTEGYESVKKQKSVSGSSYADDSMPLFMYFDSNNYQGQSFPEFNGFNGGQSGGAGAGGSFGESSPSLHESSHSHSESAVVEATPSYDSRGYDGASSSDSSSSSSCSSSSCSSGCSGGD